MHSLKLFVLIGTSMLCVLSCNSITDSWVSNQDTYMIDGCIQIPRPNGVYRIQPYNSHIVETSFIPTGETYTATSHAVVLKPTAVETQLVETDSTLVYSTEGIRVQITKTPFQISYYYKDQPLIAENKGYIATDSTEVLDFALDTEEVIYGAGARVVGMNRRGHRLQLYNKAHYGYETSAPLMNYTMPLILSSKRYAVHFDNVPIGFLDIDSKGDNTLQYETISGRKTYQVIAGSTWETLMDQYTTLTGKQPMPPRWALGNFASRFGYHSAAETAQTIQRFKADSIPLDAVILDIYWFGKDIKGHMGNLAFQKDSFPNPKQMINDFRKQGIKTVLITEPFVLSTSDRWEEAVQQDVLAKDTEGNPYQYDFYFGNTGLIDIYNPKGKKWFWDIYKHYTQSYNVAGWWGDLGEPEVHPTGLVHATGTADEVHNIYGHDWARLVYEGYRKDFPTQRPFILMRAGYSGSQRFGMIPWSGDVNRSWGGLQSQTEITLAMGMQGLGYMHSDLGGFAGGDTFDPELYTRWLQYGVFQPIYRPHGQEHIAPEPVFHDAKTKALAKQSIELRYRMLPYNYTLAFENHQTGMPLMRPLFFTDTTQTALHTLSDTYTWGDAFLVSPITAAGVEQQKMYFPAKTHWYDFYTDTVYAGGRYHTIPTEADHIPLFVKGGAFIPMIAPIQHTERYTTHTLDLHYYHDPLVTESTGQLYDDDGRTPDAYATGAYELLKFRSTYNQHHLVFDFEATTGKKYMQTTRSITFIIHEVQQQPTQLTMNEQQVPYTWDATTNQLQIPIAWDSAKAQHIAIQFD